MPEVITDNLDLWTSALLTRSTAGRGNNSKLEAYGIRKLRELILELAVRGKLLPQDPSDEPASGLLEKIAKEKLRLIKEGKISKEKPLPKIAEEELDYELPSGWVFVRLGDVAYSQAGFAFKSNFFNENSDGLPLIRIRDVGQPFTGTYYSGEYREEFLVEKGDYLISMDGEFRVSPWTNGAALLNQRVSRLFFYYESVGQRFIADSLQARLRELQGVKAYTTVDHLSGTQITAAVIGLPPLAEQHRIVAKVDELMALCDQLEQQQTHSLEANEKLVETLLGTLTRVESQQEFSAAWARIASHFDTLFTTEASIDQLKQAILQLAVMGRLNNSSPVKRVTLSELIELVSGQHLLADEQNTEGRGIPYLTGPSDFGEQYPIPTRWTDSPKVIAQPGDILVTVKGSGVGKTNKLVAGPTAISRQLMAVRVIGANPDFIHLVLQHAADHFQASMTGIAIPGIGRKDILSLETDLPSLEEQRRIVAKVDELMALCDALKARLGNAQAIQIYLADAIVELAVC